MHIFPQPHGLQNAQRPSGRIPGNSHHPGAGSALRHSDRSSEDIR
jgi:hypothetical protein